MKLALASDHGGFKLKGRIIAYLRSKGHEVTDLGTNSADSVDYPVFGKKCAEYVVSGQVDRGIVLCGTGIGISIAANKIKGARCALVNNETLAELAYNHNKTNLIAMGGRTTDYEDAIRYIDIWLNEPFDGGERHRRRVQMLNDLP
jgi:ribose 5-phosphate isomerase B